MDWLDFSITNGFAVTFKIFTHKNFEIALRFTASEHAVWNIHHTYIVFYIHHKTQENYRSYRISMGNCWATKKKNKKSNENVIFFSNHRSSMKNVEKRKRFVLAEWDFICIHIFCFLFCLWIDLPHRIIKSKWKQSKMLPKQNKEL